MVSLPTSAQSGERIAAFYIAHGELIVLQQIVGVAALGAFIAFALSLRPSRWLRPALWLFAVTELATNVIPLVMEASNPRADTAHMLTVAEDIADSALFIAIAVFVAAATMTQPVGFTALDVVAPLAFVAFVIVLSVKSLVRRQSAAVLS